MNCLANEYLARLHGEDAVEMYDKMGTEAMNSDNCQNNFRQAICLFSHSTNGHEAV
jgi:hypothetical protein